MNIIRPKNAIFDFIKLHSNFIKSTFRVANRCDSNMEKFMKRRKLNTKTNKEEERMVLLKNIK